MPSIQFEKVTLLALKTVNGKTIKKEFFQTISPFNKKEGRVKTKEQIMIELQEEANAWKLTESPS